MNKILRERRRGDRDKIRNIPRPRLRLSDLVLFIFRDGCQAGRLADWLDRQRSNKLTELGAGVDGCLGGVVGGQVLQVLLPSPRRHRDKLVRPVGRVLRVDDLRQEELGEG